MLIKTVIFPPHLNLMPRRSWSR